MILCSIHIHSQFIENQQTTDTEQYIYILYLPQYGEFVPLTNGLY